MTTSEATVAALSERVATLTEAISELKGELKKIGATSEAVALLNLRVQSLEVDVKDVREKQDIIDRKMIPIMWTVRGLVALIIAVASAAGPAIWGATWRAAAANEAATGPHGQQGTKRDQSSSDGKNDGG